MIEYWVPTSESSKSFEYTPNSHPRTLKTNVLNCLGSLSYVLYMYIVANFICFTPHNSKDKPKTKYFILTDWKYMLCT